MSILVIKFIINHVSIKKTLEKCGGEVGGWVVGGGGGVGGVGGGGGGGVHGGPLWPTAYLRMIR